MGAGGGKQTVGYRYHIGFRVVLSHGPVDGFRGIRYDGREVWSGNIGASGPIDVDLPDLMGGESREGGISGRFSVAFGDSTQGVSSYLQDKLGGNVPAFRRRLSVIAEQIYYGTNPYLKEFSWIPQRANAREVSWYDAKAEIGDGHMNPAHMIVDAITSQAFGAGLPLSVIDNASFTASADTLFTEGFGLSLLWTFASEPEAVPKFVQLVLDHIGGVLFPDPATGLIRLELLRGGYSIPALPLFDDSNCTITEYGDVQIGDTINEVVVTYTDPDTGEPRTISGQNIGNVNAQGRVVSAAIDYPGIMDDALAARVLDRDLRALSTPLATAVLEVNRTGWDLYPGKVIRVSSAKLGISEGVFRVVELDETGIADVPTISARVVQDVFGLSSGSYVVRQPTQWVDPVQPVADLSLVLLREVPYYHLVRNSVRIEDLQPDYGFVAAFSKRDDQSWYSFATYYSPDNTTYTALPSDGTFSPVLTLAAAIGPMDTNVAFSAMVDKQLVSIGNYGVLIEGAVEEMVEITAWDPVAATATLKRSVMDSVPRGFGVGAQLVITSFPGGYDSTERTDGETAWYKLTPRNRDGALAAASATARSITLANRASRPYPPGNVRINGAYFPVNIAGAFTIDWAHRDRLQQTAGLTPWTSGNIGPEPGTTYTLRLYGQAGTLLRTETGLTGNTYSWANEVADSGIIGAGEDEYWNNVIALLHMDGTNGSTTFTDQKGHTFTATGNAQISTAQSKFGGASALFDGTGDLVSSADHADWALGAGD
ncbi:MAG: phage tail protein, partial [Hyphomicrobiaceae bacterium]